MPAGRLSAFVLMWLLLWVALRLRLRMVLRLLLLPRLVVRTPRIWICVVRAIHVRLAGIRTRRLRPACIWRIRVRPRIVRHVGARILWARSVLRAIYGVARRIVDWAVYIAVVCRSIGAGVGRPVILHRRTIVAAGSRTLAVC